MEDKSVIPLTVDVSDPNIAYFYFPTLQAGRAIVVAEAARGEGIRVTDGTNIFDGATRLGFNGQDFYLSNEGHGDPVVNMKPIDITNFDTSSLVKVDGSNPFTGDQSMGGNQLTNVGTPIVGTDAANKTYVDDSRLDVTLSNVASPFFTNATKLTFRQEDFYLDTDSAGQPVVNIRGGTGGGSSGQFGTGIFAQDFSSSSEWILNHNLGVNNIIWSVYDDQGNAVIPEKVSVHNPNTAYFYFLPATSGRAVVGGGPVFQAASGSITVGETDGNPPNFAPASTLLFNSNDFYLKANSSSQPVVNFRGTAGGGGGGVTDHGALTGLLDDDHPQYILTDGTRAFSGVLKGNLHVEHVVVAEAFYLTPGSGGEFSKSGNDVVIRSKDGRVVLDDTVSLNNNSIQDVQNPVNPQDVATKAYTDTLVTSLTPGLFYVREDTNPSLGGDLDVNYFTIKGTDTTGITDGGNTAIRGGNAAGTGRGGSVNINGGTSVGASAGGVNVNAPGSVVNLIASDINVTVDNSLDMGSKSITNLLNPTGPQDAATKNYVDANGGITAVVQDPAPVLGGNLDTDGKSIVSDGSVTILASRNGSGTGSILIQTDLAFYFGANSAPININAGTSSTGSGGDVSLGGGVAVTSGDGGDVFISGGDTNSGIGGDINLAPGVSVLGTSGQIVVFGDVNMNTFYIHNLAYPEQPSDAATKKYVDNHSSAGGGISTVTDGVSTYSNQTALGFSNQSFYVSRGSGGKPVVNLRTSLEQLSAYLDFPIVGNTFLETFSDHVAIIDGIQLVCRAGTATAGFYIVPAANPAFRDGTKVGGADPITISSTPQRIIPTSARTLQIGDALKMAIYVNANAKGVRVKVSLRKNS